MAHPLQNKHRLWAEIDLGRLTANYKIAQKNAHGGKIMPVIKADAYGHGAVQAALALRDAGADFFAVATPEEALQLRRHGVGCGILLLGAAPVSHLPALAAAGVTLCVPDTGTARVYGQTLGSRPADVHIKFNTGMTRLGLPSATAVRDALEIASNLRVTGLFTHFASADDPSEDGFTRSQFNTFMAVCEALRGHGLTGAVLHSANSAALLGHPYTHLDYARPGLMLYGYSPCGGGEGLRPVLSLYSSIMQCHTVPAGTTVSYGRAWTAERESVIATVPVGYADGLSWALSGSGMVMLVRGRQAPLIGRICMDFCALDVTGIPGAAPGDLVTVLGDGIDAADHARLSGTIPWEVLCSIGRRVPRVYRRDGEIIEETNDIDRL
ncbi:MAG: alanine racemase [Oscillospiraceae bacterium]|jgi:alanine racemase|nr:alanine racemase [Oscillospiraceae bacterium]